MSYLDFLILGINGGMSFGVISSLMLAETLKNGFKSGVKVPLALILTNLIIAPLCVALLYFGTATQSFIKYISIAGAGVLIFIAYKEWQASVPTNFDRESTDPKSNPFKKTFLLDFINPYPYIFWISIQGPSIVLHLKNGGSIEEAWLFWVFFVGGLVGTKLIHVAIIARFRHFLKPRHLKYINRIVAVVMMVYAIKILIGNF
ncbi:MAG: LysE family transporter [Patescibacteria group bacterium]